MGYGCYEKGGRDQGYNVPAQCDHPGCDKEIDRGMAYACGGDPMENCGLFFCHDHKRHDVDSEAEYTDETRHQFGVCEHCANGEQPFDPKPDIEYWRAWKMNHESWAQWREDNPDFVKGNAELIGHPKVMEEIRDTQGGTNES